MFSIEDDRREPISVCGYRVTALRSRYFAAFQVGAVRRLGGRTSDGVTARCDGGSGEAMKKL